MHLAICSMCSFKSLVSGDPLRLREQYLMYGHPQHDGEELLCKPVRRIVMQITLLRRAGDECCLKIAAFALRAASLIPADEPEPMQPDVDIKEVYVLTSTKLEEILDLCICFGHANFTPAEICESKSSWCLFDSVSLFRHRSSRLGQWIQDNGNGNVGDADVAAGVGRRQRRRL